MGFISRRNDIPRYTCKFCLFLRDDHLDLESLKKAASWFNFTCNHAPPPPGICNSVFLGGTDVFPTPGTQKETIPHPQAPDRPHIQFFQHLFHPCKSKTTHFHEFYERFPEFIERRIMNVIMQLKHEQKRKTL